MINIITRPDTNICKAICATLTVTNKTTETLAIEVGDRYIIDIFMCADFTFWRPASSLILSGAQFF
jgi:hypothetical protein